MVRKSVRVQRPLIRPPRYKFPDHAYRWYWSRTPLGDGGGGNDDLEEEQIGVWERKFIEINDGLPSQQRQGMNVSLGGGGEYHVGDERRQLLPRADYLTTYGLYDFKPWENWYV